MMSLLQSDPELCVVLTRCARAFWLFVCVAVWSCGQCVRASRLLLCPVLADWLSTLLLLQQQQQCLLLAG